MAFQVYKKGNAYTVRGIECDIENVALSSVQGMLDNGWYNSPEEIDNGVQEPQKDEDEEAPKEEIPEEEKVLNPARIEAKEKDIEGWDTKRIKTLQAELDELKD